MTAKTPVFEAELELDCGNTLGEGRSLSSGLLRATAELITCTGIIWDSRTKLLHWVDIDDAQIHT